MYINIPTCIYLFTSKLVQKNILDWLLSHADNVAHTCSCYPMHGPITISHWQRIAT